MQNINAYMAQALGQTLEETTDLLTESLTLRHLQKYGSVTLEESTFYHNLSATIITEAAEDFIPDEVETMDPADVGEAVELYDAAGNCYLYDSSTGSLTPCDAPAEGGDMGAAPVDPVDPAEEPAPVTESTVVEPDARIIEESTAPAQVSVVNRILANIK